MYMAINNSCGVPISFHFIQSWYRKTQELGLTSEYKNNNWLKHTFGLQYLSPSEISAYFSFDFKPDIQNDSNYSKYTDYLLENYVNENFKFPTSL